MLTAIKPPHFEFAEADQSEGYYPGEELYEEKVMEEPQEFHVFADYFGLFNLVKSFWLRNDAQQEAFLMEDEPRSRNNSVGSDFSSNSLDSGEYIDFGLSYLGDPFSLQTLENDENRRGKTREPPSVLLARRQAKAMAGKNAIKQEVCVFCRNNGEEESFYASHSLKDSEGRVTCPVLRAYTCPICGANGDEAHTIKYCPQNQSKSITSNNTSTTNLKRLPISGNKKK
ncbi:nanos homolog 1-like [Dysidea avara]|uniref:nanos homolog 1-like n=1 Tax=Dysidea avara TaxID=196820 RepID=UPI00331BF3ED